jgi:two-component system, sensor histidine kinase YesM
MNRPSIGIRGKILLFYGGTLALVIALEVVAQDAALRAGSDFEDRLSRYHAVQGLRSSLEDYRALGERYMREGLPEQRSELEAELDSIVALSASLSRLAEDSQDAFFEARAARRGLDAWTPLARNALERRGEDAPDAYQDYAKADRIAVFVDGYLGKLLSLSLASGASRYRALAARSRASRRLALIGLVGAGALAMAFAAIFASSIAAPIRRLAEAADRMAAGDLDLEPVSADSGDEVAVLARGFNAMSASIRAMVEGLEEKAELERLVHERDIERVSMGRALREAQFMNLQDQIRPHFLFNALNTIARSALFEGAPDTERLALSLGKLMRYSLSEGGSFVSLGEELATLREYLSFQGIRFGERLAWEIRSEPGVESLSIPRFTLQPIVENAVRHGIEPKVEGGRVIVSARRRAGRVRLVVADSGMGMDAALLERLRASACGAQAVGDPAATGDATGVHGGDTPLSDAVSVGEGRPGIGMANLELRLAYRYPGSARLSLVSRPGRGTLVRISLPAVGLAGCIGGPDAD